ncbi:uncharacterized protein FIBRA_07191 [Fibroporia radiculosa]|uniref:Major facilitator superfamily (MFS) profile domain-containing protein n=1 Tax=Fibroporia radiculosa TaxID=599839 RepID=J4GDR0_9APHY|nr:uncharacterized protein FIBRA_07191 [Fibroporia radiculosa]CCM04993.1 predicted protein [Fibroporia radiculosa]
MLLTARLFIAVGLSLRGVASQTPYSETLGPLAWTAPGVFPTSLYQSYYNDPTATSAEPQPVITDPITHETYPYWITNPETIPESDTFEPHPFPPPVSTLELAEVAFQQILSIASSPGFGNDTCARCLAALEVGKFVALATPEQTSLLAVRVCEYYNFTTDCEGEYGPFDTGGVIAQVIQLADVAGYDGQMICNYFLSLCPVPPTSPLDLTNWFAKPKPDPLPAPKQPTGQRLKVLHLSDLHIDPRYTIGAEANCTSYLCCRPGVYNADNPEQVVLPAPRYGSFYCDAPYPLVVNAFQAVQELAGGDDGFDFTIFTGDLLSHDSHTLLSAMYTLYTETVLYDLIKQLIKTGPVYAVQGNHDTYNYAQNSPYNIENGLVNQYNWNYDHLAALWELDGQLSPEAAQQARTHYASYSVQRQDGLRIITLNTDFWYTQNMFNYINLSSSDNSGMLRFLTDELQDAEDAEERVWILGHVQSGWDTADPLENPTNLFYQIVDRYSPHVIAGVFFGHTHEDQVMIYYNNNATNISVANAQTVGWIGPSLTPLTAYNSGFRVYEVDSGTFEILDSYTYIANVSLFPELDGQTQFGPVFELEYSARDTYGGNITWDSSDPLNATWWHLVTEAMYADPALVEAAAAVVAVVGSEENGDIDPAGCLGQNSLYKTLGLPPGDEETPLLHDAHRTKPTRTPIPWSQLSILLVLQLAEPLTSQVIAPFAPELIRSIGITGGDEAKVGYYVGLMYSLFFATQAVTVLHWSRLSDRVGRKPVIMTGLLGLSLSMYSFGLSRTFWGLVVSRSLNGALNGNIGVLKSMMAEITDSTNIAEAYAYLPISWMAGGTLGPMIGGALSHPHERFSNIFGHMEIFKTYPYLLACAVPATFSSIAFLVTLFFLKETVASPVSIRRIIKLRKSKANLTLQNVVGADGPKPPTPFVSSKAAVEPLPLRALLIPRVIISAGNYALLAIVDISYRTVLPVYMSTPIDLGGLGLSPQMIGTILSVYGLMNGVIQIMLFSRVINRWGAKKVYVFGIASALPVFALCPAINVLARAQGYSVTVWTLLVVQTLISIPLNFCYGSVFIYITASSPNRSSLGSVNGLSQMSVSIMRAIGPAFANSMFSLSIDKEHHYLHGMLVYVFLACLAFVALGVATLLPTKVWKDDAEETS